MIKQNGIALSDPKEKCDSYLRCEKCHESLDLENEDFKKWGIRGQKTCLLEKISLTVYRFLCY